MSTDWQRYIDEEFDRAEAEWLEQVSLIPELKKPLCQYCAGQGGRYRWVYSRFLGTEAQAHQGPWEKCSFCGGTGLANG